MLAQSEMEKQDCHKNSLTDSGLKSMFFFHTFQVAIAICQTVQAGQQEEELEEWQTRPTPVISEQK